jgi:signal transduction histidine kinase
MITRQQVIGVLEIVNKRDGSLFDENEAELLLALASQAAVAIENAVLYAKLQERAETLQQAYDELAKIDQLKDELVQNISHELRTPIAFIKGYVNLLLDGDLGELSPQQFDSLEIVSNKTEQLVHLVNGILTLQTLTTEAPNVESISPIVLVTRTVAAAIPAAQAAGIDLVSDYPEKLPAVAADPPQITQVLDNLLNNAIKFSPAGGTVTVKLSAEENMIRIQVSDTGIGIPADKIDRIFDRFYQIDGSSTRQFGGAGLGLAICKQIIDAHDGKFEVESEVGKGSTFAFLLPQAQSK